MKKITYLATKEEYKLMIALTDKGMFDVDIYNGEIALNYKISSMRVSEGEGYKINYKGTIKYFEVISESQIMDIVKQNNIVINDTLLLLELRN